MYVCMFRCFLDLAGDARSEDCHLADCLGLVYFVCVLCGFCLVETQLSSVQVSSTVPVLQPASTDTTKRMINQRREGEISCYKGEQELLSFVYQQS